MNLLITLFCGVVIGILLTLAVYIFRIIKKENTKTQRMNNKLQSLLDEMSARDIYIHKMSQNNLIWDHRTKTFIRNGAKNE
jgi:MFS superfamily sulfate permease-like transporter